MPQLMYNLDPEDIEYIITAYCLGKLTRYELADKFNLPKTSIDNVCNTYIEDYLPKIFTKEQLEEIRDTPHLFLVKKYKYPMLAKVLKSRVGGKITKEILGIKMRCYKCVGTFLRLPDTINCPHCGTTIDDPASAKESNRRAIIRS